MPTPPAVDDRLLDGRPGHFVVRGNRIAGLIDVHDLSAGDPAMDLAVFAVADEALLPAVLDGYAPMKAEAAAFAELIPFYVHVAGLLTRVSDVEALFVG